MPESRRARCVGYGQKREGKGKCDGMCSGIKDNDGICNCEKESSRDLPFFESCPDKEFDKFYCGCWNYGWD